MPKFKLYKQTKLKLLLAAIIVVPLISHCFFSDKPVVTVQPQTPAMMVKEISAPELNAFLRVWPAYVEEGIINLGYAQISLSAKPSAKDMDKKLTGWLEEKKWDADRFFYVEQRLRTILKTIENDKLILNNIEGLRSQLKVEGGQQLTAMIHDLIMEQQQKLNVEKISKPELDMVISRQKEIENILNTPKPAVHKN